MPTKRKCKKIAELHSGNSLIPSGNSLIPSNPIAELLQKGTKCQGELELLIS